MVIYKSSVKQSKFSKPVKIKSDDVNIYNKSKLVSTIKVIIEKSRGEVSLMEQETIINVS